MTVNNSSERALVLEAVLAERERQDASFGEQNHDDRPARPRKRQAPSG